MELQTTINLLLSVGFAALGWFAREMWAAVKELKGDLAKLREEIPKEYSPKYEVRDNFNELKQLLIAINIKLDTKADK